VANDESSKKRMRQTVKRTERNKHNRTYTRTLVKRVRVAIESGDKSAAQGALALAVRQIDRAVSKGLYHRRTGSRYIARLSAQVNSLAA